jgi:hypothetical protein
VPSCKGNKLETIQNAIHCYRTSLLGNRLITVRKMESLRNCQAKNNLFITEMQQANTDIV